MLNIFAGLLWLTQNKSGKCAWVVYGLQLVPRSEMVYIPNQIGGPMLLSCASDKSNRCPNLIFYICILSGVVTLYCVLGITLELKTSPAQTSFSAMLTAFQFPWLPLSPVLRVVVGTQMIWIGAPNHIDQIFIMTINEILYFCVGFTSGLRFNSLLCFGGFSNSNLPKGTFCPKYHFGAYS